MTPHSRKRFQFPWRTPKVIAGELDAELAFHLEMRAAELAATGMSAADARREAEREFGDLEFTRRYCRSQDEGGERAIRRADRIGELRQNIGYALRTLRRSPGFTAVALITLALAIGANTAIFSVMNAVLLRPLPYGRPDELVAVYENKVAQRVPRSDMSSADFVDYRSGQHALSGLAAFNRSIYTLRAGDADPVVVPGTRVTANMFDVLQVGALRGRTFAADEDSPAKKYVAVLAYDAWQRLFGGDTGIVGRSISLNDASYTVIGVMPRGFDLGFADDLWVPLDMSPVLADANRARKFHNLYGIARLKPAASIDVARADLLGIARGLEAQYPDANTGHLVTVLPLRDTIVGDLRPATLVLAGAAALVLLIACANLANVTLSRTVARRREMAVRAAIGAGRGRLARQLLTESLLLAVGGGALGIGVAYAGTRLLFALNPNVLPPQMPASVDTRVLLFGLAVSIATGVLFGLLPAMNGTRLDLHEALKASSRGATGGGAAERMRRGLVVAQVALAVVLLVGAGLLVRSFNALQRVDTGFDPDRVLVTRLWISGNRYDSLPAMNQLYDDIFAKLRATPGVEAVGATSGVPLLGGAGCRLTIAGVPALAATVQDVRCGSARGDYFPALRIPLLRGRLFDRTDLPTGPQVLVINESMARQFWPNGDPIGKRVRLGSNPSAPWETIVGVVGDIRQSGLASAPQPTAFELDDQHAWGSLDLTIRTAGDPMRAAPAVRAVIRAIDSAIAIRGMRSMDEVVGTSIAARRFSLTLMTCFALVAVLLAVVGVYGVLAYAVTSRTREFGIRMALGASARNVLVLVLGQGLVWAVAGLALGVGGALASGRLLERFLFGVRPTDVTTFAVVCVTLLGAVLAACVIPARRATRVDPIGALREE